MLKRGMEEEGKYGRNTTKLTIARPLEVLRAQPARSILVDLEPDRTLAVKVGRRLAGGHLRHVEVQRTGVADVGVDGEGVVGAGGDGQGLGSALAGVQLVAGHGLRGHVLHGAVGVTVFRRADVLPLAGDSAGGVSLGEGVWR